LAQIYTESFSIWVPTGEAHSAPHTFYLVKGKGGEGEGMGGEGNGGKRKEGKGGEVASS